MNKYVVALIALAVLLFIGALLGVLLTIASKTLAVKEDPRIKVVESRLPNANCGNCGYPGCHELAAALVSGEETKVTKCKVGNKDKNFIPIINYLKEHPGEDGNSHVPSL